jgi:translocation and assembly module TamB
MIDLEAAARSEEIQAVVRLEGPAANPKLELTSEPTLPQDEILARLLFGRSVARLTPVQGLRLAAAVDTLRGGGGLSDVLSTLRKGLGVDTLDVAGGETAQESTAKAGKYVSDNVFVEVERGVAEGTGKARVQVELTPNLSVNTEVDEQSQSGVGLEYRYDY